MTFLSIEVTGNKELLAELRRARARLEDPRELLSAVGQRLEANIERRFDAKRDPNGAPWAPLAESTREAYARSDKGRRAGTLLQRTGQMRDSLRSNVLGDDVVEVGMNRITDDGDWQIPLLHETGTTRMPRRGIFFADPDAGQLGAEDAADIDREIADYLDDVFGAA